MIRRVLSLQIIPVIIITQLRETTNQVKFFKNLLQSFSGGLVKWWIYQIFFICIRLAGLTFLMMTSAITWIMLPGVGFFYSGMARSKSALSLLMLCLWSCAIVSIQVWICISYLILFLKTCRHVAMTLSRWCDVT